MFFSIFFLAWRRDGRDRFTKENDPVHYMRELEFRNTIDQYDLAIVMFFKKDVQECKQILPQYRYAAYKSRGRADYIAISAKTAPDLIDELGVDTFPTIFSFRYGHLIEKFNKTYPRDIFYYCKNVTTYKYKYIHDAQDVPESMKRTNNTLVVALPLIDARLDRLLAVVGAKYIYNMSIVVATTEDIAKAYGVNYNKITILRQMDDATVEFSGEPKKATVKSLSDFVGKNIVPHYEIISGVWESVNLDEQYFLALYDTVDKKQQAIVKEVLEKVYQEHHGKFPIRYADAFQYQYNITKMHLENYQIPLFLFLKPHQSGYEKYVYTGKPNGMAVAAFCADQLRKRNPLTIIDTPVPEKPKGLVKYYTGSELFQALEKQEDKDFIVNFVGHPCPHCPEVDTLIEECAQWTKNNSIKHVVWARVNATNNDIPTVVWRNETYPYAWMFPAKNRDGAFPAGKRRSLYSFAMLLFDNSTQKITAPLPPKPYKNYRLDIEKERAKAHGQDPDEVKITDL